MAADWMTTLGAVLAKAAEASAARTKGTDFMALVVRWFRVVGFTFLVFLDLTISWTQGGKRVVPQHSVRRPVS
jgi:hypothetical protein